MSIRAIRGGLLCGLGVLVLMLAGCEAPKTGTGERWANQPPVAVEPDQGTTNGIPR